MASITSFRTGSSSTFFNRLTRSFQVFKEALLSTDLEDDIDFSSWQARRLRYAIFWAFYEGTIYSDLHKFANKYKTDFGLYRYIRSIYNPAQRLGDFYETHLMGGQLDPLAGDGQNMPSPLPIMVPPGNKDNDERLREAIAQIWLWSNWGKNKDIVSLWGSILGDVVLTIVDDTELGQVYIDILHPGVLKQVEFDRKGNIKSYVIEEDRPDPDSDKQSAKYTEIASRDGDNVVYQTFRNGTPFDWNPEFEFGAEWSVKYGFIPMVIINHKNVGIDWGWAEMHASRSLFHEVDDLASKLHDHIRKSVDPIWFFAGVSKQKAQTSLDKPKTEPTRDRPKPGREEIPAIYANNPQATAIPLTGDIDIEHVVAELKQTITELERKFPELQVDIARAIQTNSGRALRIARQDSEVKVVQRRANYDDGIVKIHQMAISIGVFREYEAFKGFKPDSFENGDLMHFIGKRSVFAKDPLDDLEIEKEMFENAGLALNVGIPLEFYLGRQGWSEEDLERLAKAKAEQPEAEDEEEEDESEQESSQST